MAQISLQTPIVGNPDSSEEPKIPSDFSILQTLLNGQLDATNLLPSSGIWRFNYRLVSSNVTAANGDWIVAQGGLTITLPPPSLNALVAITAKVSVSSTSFITVAAAEVLGLGMGSGTTSFRLGTPGASVVLQSDGITWRIVSGQQDTGWVALTINHGITGGGYTPAARLVGDRVELCGSISVTGSLSDGVPWATLPTAAFRPAQLVELLGGIAGTSNNNGNVIVQTGGGIASSIPVPSLNVYVMFLDGAFYRVV